MKFILIYFFLPVLGLLPPSENSIAVIIIIIIIIYPYKCWYGRRVLRNASAK